MLAIEATTADTFRFPDTAAMASALVSYSDLDHRWGAAEAHGDLIVAGATASTISREWVANHYRWIVWKLASLERSFPQKFGQKLCRPDSVLNQLRYRYEREVNLGERSALRKITEKDDTPARELVLCVWDIVTSETTSSPSFASCLRLTDGWYSLNAHIDSHLAALVANAKIFVGQKLRLWGAELVGLSDPCPPLETPDDVWLKLTVNGTHRAPWDSKLGYQKRSPTRPVSLAGIYMKGGVIPCVDVVVMRCYPIRFQDVLPSGQKVVMNQVEKEQLDRGRRDEAQRKVDSLTSESSRTGTSHQAEIETVLEESRLRVRSSFSFSSSSRASPIDTFFFRLQEREESMFFKVRLCDYPLTEAPGDKQCILTLWRPTDDDMRTFTEGKRLRVSSHFCFLLLSFILFFLYFFFFFFFFFFLTHHFLRARYTP